MRTIFILLALLIWHQAAVAQIGIYCKDQLPETEKTVCSNEFLLWYDKTLASIHAVFSYAVAQPNVASFLDKQSDWQKRRDKCGKDTKCIENHYINRLSDASNITIKRLPPKQNFGGGNDGEIIRREYSNEGRLVEIYKNGKRIEYSRTGEIFYFYPDGSGPSIQPMQAVAATLPPLPPQAQKDTKRIIATLGQIIRGKISGQAFDAMKQEERGLSDRERITYRLLIVKHLMGNKTG